jgi:uncharacterized caspase-like protein
MLKSPRQARTTGSRYSFPRLTAGLRRIAPLLALALLLGGCASFPSRDIGYAVPAGFRAGTPLPYHLAVMKFTDARPSSQHISGTPVGGTRSGDDWFRGSLRDEVPKMIARDFASANIFESVAFAGSSPIDARPNTLYLEGTIHSFEYIDGNYAPPGKYNVTHVKLSFQLRDAQNTVIWKSPVHEAYRFPTYFSLHWNQSNEMGFPYIVEAFAECVNELKQDLYSSSSKWASAVAVPAKAAVTATPAASAPPAPPPARMAAPPLQKWAVVIGISRYKDTRIAGLRYASADARAFHDWLVSQKGGGYAPAQVKLLVDTEATAQNIRNALFNWLRKALEEDMVTIYFAGHGSPESPDSLANLYLLPYDANYADIASTGFPMWDIETALKRFIKAKKVVVIADACHSGGVGQAFDIARRANRGVAINPIGTGLQNLSQTGEGIAVISAADDKQTSQEGRQWGDGHGVFTYYLLKGLNGEADYNRDGRVTLGELIPYLSEKVRRETMNAQSPTVAGKFDPSLPIGQ